MNFGGTIRLNKFGVCIVTALLFLLIFYITSSYKSDSELKNVVSLKKLLIASIETAIKGGKQVVDVHKSPDLQERVKGKTKEGANELVTTADERSNCVMYYSLTHAYPEIKVISEESSPESGCRAYQNLEFDQNVLGTNEIEDEEVSVSDVKVWIDPLDATQEFTEKLLEYVTTMVCVAVKGEPVIGVIHFPFGEEPRTTWAWVGKGVSSDIKQKSARTVDESIKSIIISRSHKGEVEKIVKEALGENVNIISAGGSGYKSLEVASKNVTAYVHTTEIKKWDICAGNAILNALNGHMTTLKNEKITYGSPEEKVNHNGLLATLGEHEQIVDKLKLILKKDS